MIKKKSHRSNVFVVYGRNSTINESMFSFLESLGLKPLEWEDIVSQCNDQSPYVGEALEKGFEISQAAVVLFTPDDEARLVKNLQGKNEKKIETELTLQPRQNVLFEAGMAMGKFPDRTIIVEIGELRSFSDGVGRHTIRMNNSPEKRNALATRLENAGCVVNKKGDRWLNVGNFSIDLNQESDSSVKGNASKTDETPTKNNFENFIGIGGGVNLLIENGFFATPKSAKEIREELQNNGYFCSPQEVQWALKIKIGKNKPLKKFGSKKPLRFVLQK